MLLPLKDDNTTGSLWLYYLFYILSMIYVYMYKMCNSMFICNYGMYRWCDYWYVSLCTIGCCWHGVLLVDCLLFVVCVYADVIWLQVYLCHHTVYYYISTPFFLWHCKTWLLLIIWYLSHDPWSLHVYYFITYLDLKLLYWVPIHWENYVSCFNRLFVLNLSICFSMENFLW